MASHPAPRGESRAEPLAAYAAALSGKAQADIFTAAAPATATQWQAVAGALLAQGGGDPAEVQALIDRQVEDLGLAFRQTGDDHERMWPLAPMPILIGAEEWAGLEAGLTQRSRLIEALLGDIYGRQSLITSGALPAAVITGNPDFTPAMVGLIPPGGHFVQVHSVDLARDADGRWRVLADRVRLATGIGYALENRMALARATGGLLGRIGARRLSDFFDDLRQGIAAQCGRAEPRIGLLTPGRFNQSYPEQAHLARQLGFSLVEGRDLVVSDARAFMRTIAGLKRIDALWRWINTADIDPLAFDSRSRIGVADLASAWTRGGLVMANWPGGGVIESPALAPYLPAVARALLGEELTLLMGTTRWCAGDGAADFETGIDDAVVASAFGTRVAGLGAAFSVAVAGLTPDAQDHLRAAMAWRPMDYVVQDAPRLSTTPCLTNGGFVPRAFTLRAFIARGADGAWNVMPGGLARLSGEGQVKGALIAEGEVSADVCVIEAQAPIEPTALPLLVAPPVRRADGILPSLAADNLFWLGRYCERAAMIARVVRTLLATASVEGNASGPRDARLAGRSVTPRLVALLVRLGAVPEKAADRPAGELAAVALGVAPPRIAAGDANAAAWGDVGQIIISIRAIGLLLRDRLSPDCWRLVNRSAPRHAAQGDRREGDWAAGAAERLIERFAALHHLLGDYLSRSPAWHFLELGRAIERAALVVQAARELVPGSASGDDLAALMDLFDAQPIYRSRYLAMPFIAPVFDLVLLDAAQPRSLAFQLSAIARHLAALPTLGADGLPELPLRLARALAAEVEALDAGAIDCARLDAISGTLVILSDAIARRFFQQSDPPLPPSSIASLQA